MHQDIRWLAEVHQDINIRMASGGASKTLHQINNTVFCVTGYWLPISTFLTVQPLGSEVPVDGPMITEPLGAASVKYLEVVGARNPSCEVSGTASPINHGFHVLLLHTKQLLSQLLPHLIRHASQEVGGSFSPRRNWSIDLTMRHKVTISRTQPPPHPKTLPPPSPSHPKTFLTTTSWTPPPSPPQDLPHHHIMDTTSLPTPRPLSPPHHGHHLPLHPKTFLTTTSWTPPPSPPHLKTFLTTTSWTPPPSPSHPPKNQIQFPSTVEFTVCTRLLTCENTASLASSTSLSLKEPFEAHSSASWKRFSVSKELGSL